MATFRPLTIIPLFVFGMLLVSPVSSELPEDLTALSPATRMELSESYYLAGLQYQAVGNLEMAASMAKIAFSLNPELDPKQITEQELSTVGDLPTSVITKATTTDPSYSWSSQVVISRLLRLASELLTENADTAVAFLDGSVYLSGPGTPGIAVTRARAHIELSGLFERVSLTDLTIAEIYDISSVVAELYHSPNRSMSGAFQVSITAQTDLSSEVPFWDSKQRFVFRPVNDSWLVTGIFFGSGQQLPSD